MGATDRLDKVMRKMARIKNEQALEKMAQRDYPGALFLFREAYDAAPDDSEITNNLAFMYERLGNRDQAEFFYKESLRLDPERGVAHLNLADLMATESADREILKRALHHLARAREIRGNQPEIVLRQGRVSGWLGRFDAAWRFYQEFLKLMSPTAEHQLELGDFFSDFGRFERAIVWYQKVAGDESQRERAAQKIWAIEVDREARRYGWLKPTGQVSSQARVLERRARGFVSDGRHDEAIRLLDKAIEMAPLFSQAHIERGDVLREMDRPKGAEFAYLHALSIKPSDAELLHKIGRLYMEWTPSGRFTEAAFFLSRALELRPAWPKIYLELAQAFRGSGDLHRAHRYLDRFLESDPPLPQRDLALALRAKMPKPSVVDPGKVNGGPSSVKSSSSTDRLGAVRLLFRQGKVDAALAKWRHVEGAQNDPAALNLKAEILLSTGQRSEAIAVFLASLKVSGGQPEVHLKLGLLLDREGRTTQANNHFHEAQSQGALEAGFHVIRLTAPKESPGALSWLFDMPNFTALWNLRARLDDIVSAAPRADWAHEASALRENLHRRIRLVQYGVVGATLVFLLLTWLFARRLWGGATIGQLLERSPDSGPEVHRVLSAVRHEVIKHNTMALTGLKDTLLRGEDIGVKAAHCSESILGSDQEPGAYQRLSQYADQLRRIGRAHGVRLNLSRRDPVFRALFAGMRSLKSVEGYMERGELLNQRQREKLLAALGVAERSINHEGHQALGEVLDQLRMFSLSPKVFRGIFDRTRREPSFSSYNVADLLLEVHGPSPFWLSVPGYAMDDILSNLFRNAIQASDPGGGSPISVGLCVHMESDDITGIERVVIGVRDRAPGALSVEDIRRQSVERGLGLTAQRVAQFEGTVDVRSQVDGWSKEVQVKFQRAQPPEGEGSNS